MSKSASRIFLCEKDQVVRALCLHYSILVSLAELEQLKRGLSLQRFSTLMESHPHLLRKAFLPPKVVISSDFIQDMYTVLFSPVGSNNRSEEQSVVMLWYQYLQEIGKSLSRH